MSQSDYHMSKANLNYNALQQIICISINDSSLRSRFFRKKFFDAFCEILTRCVFTQASTNTQNSKKP